MPDDLPDQLRAIRKGTDPDNEAILRDAAAEIEALRAEVESRRDEADAERLKRRELERWLAAVKETLRPWWQGESGWDGSLVGLPAAVEGVAGRFREVEAELGRLRTDFDVLAQFVDVRAEETCGLGDDRCEAWKACQAAKGGTK